MSLKINKKESNVNNDFSRSNIFDVSNDHNNKKQSFMKLSSSTSRTASCNLQDDARQASLMLSLI